ncbi:copper amine oxidase N-terminal domain-containing protein [Paenibacillus oenotherae]|uniref:Copper amine oxidase N-terminal domain-containing protein n=1 Tax=Paenibacillus oenotherae TaxID=1435645 RepID=A0ABS7D6H1_9BACL|nr:copper amine oxidase N-terminal domain-containing protein [Paenibacillus oenotherae]MBW7475101.1 copper amine oxidase N-terminal domain-containing protein [Paenibacillus oenotherae]
MNVIRQVVLITAVTLLSLTLLSPLSAQSLQQLQNSAAAVSTGELILYMNSSVMEQDGRKYNAARALTVKKGVTYVSLRALTERLQGSIAAVPKTKETVVTIGGTELRLKAGSSVMRVNGTAWKLRGALYADRNVLMIPVTDMAKALNIAYTVPLNSKTIVLQLAFKPVVSFTAGPDEIIAGETVVNYATMSYSPRGLAITDERWEGRQEMFTEPGDYIVRYSAMDSGGQWSEPYELTIKVVPPNTPPVASFSTDKEEYRMGEPVVIRDESSDADGDTIERKWSNGFPAYFEPGEVTIGLTVTDGRGASADSSKTIRITDEKMYAEDEFYKLFADIGKSFSINSASVKNMEAIPFTYTTEPATLFRSSGPESVYSEGILYRDDIAGDVRFMLHHKNKLGAKARLYILAQNLESEPASLWIGASGSAGPTPMPEFAGRMSLARYYEATAAGDNSRELVLAPGESKVLFEDISRKAMLQDDIITFHGDVYSSSRIRYTALLIGAEREPIAAVPLLPALDPRQSIVRGTFEGATRVFDYAGVIGDRTTKLSLTDNAADPFMSGMDGLNGMPATNSGNYGLLYKVVLRNVAPRSLIAFNPRGGSYTGAALVNGNVVSFAHLGTELSTNQASVLYRTKDNVETVEIWITPSAGSNMPFCLLFMPLPEEKQ